MILDDTDEWEPYPSAFGVRGFLTREAAEEALPAWIQRGGPGQYEISKDEAPWKWKPGYNWRIDKLE